MLAENLTLSGQASVTDFLKSFIKIKVFCLIESGKLSNNTKFTIKVFWWRNQRFWAHFAACIPVDHSQEVDGKMKYKLRKMHNTETRKRKIQIIKII